MAIEMADFVIEDTKQTELEVACFKAMRKLENEMKYVRWAQQAAKRARDEYKALVAKYEAYLEENR
jgi:hypothetical protein